MEELKNKSFLITGGSGFIGQNMQEYLLALGARNLVNIDLVPPRIKTLIPYWKECDICDLTSFQDIVTRFSPDYIIHFAARTDLDGKSVEDYSANTVGVENLMKIVQLLPDLTKVIVTSSMLVCRAGYQPRGQFDYAPSTFYGESKVVTEKTVWGNTPHCDWAIIRPTSIWGPWFKVPYRNFFEMVMSHRYFHIGHKSCSKTYGYVGNSVYQIKEILLNDTSDKNNKIFYIGDAPATNIEEWANEIAGELGYRIIRMPMWMLKIAAFCGDMLKVVKINFPMTSFRLKNMTTDNIVDLSNTYKVAPNPPYSRIEGVKDTLSWMKEE